MSREQLIETLEKFGMQLLFTIYLKKKNIKNQNYLNVKGKANEGYQNELFKQFFHDVITDTDYYERRFSGEMYQPPITSHRQRTIQGTGTRRIGKYINEFVGALTKSKFFERITGTSYDDYKQTLENKEKNKENTFSILRSLMKKKKEQYDDQMQLKF